MDSNLQTILHQISTQTFEQLAFMVARPPEVEGPESGAVAEGGVSVDNVAFSRQVRSVVNFAGPLSGALELSTSADVLNVLAGNMLAATDVPARLCQDALGEVANVLCGNLLGAVYQHLGEFRMSSPSASVDLCGRLAAEVDVITDDGPVRVRLYLRDAVVSSDDTLMVEIKR